jgi:nitrate reductase NapD
MPDRTPNPEDGREYNMCGVLVHTRPENLNDVTARIAALPGVEVHQSSPDGRLVVTIEDIPGRWAGETLTDMQTEPGVLSASLVYHHCEIAPDRGAAAKEA